MSETNKVKDYMIANGWDLRKSTQKDTDAICMAFYKGIACVPIKGLRIRGVCGCGKTMAVSMLYKVRTNGLAVMIECTNTDQVAALENPIDFDAAFGTPKFVRLYKDAAK